MRAAGVAAALIAATAAAQEAQYLPFRMLSTQDQPHSYHVDSRTPGPLGVEPSGLRAATDRAWQSWNQVACAAPKVVSLGPTSGVVPRPSDRLDSFSVTPAWFLQETDPDFIAVMGSRFIPSVTVPRTYAGVLQTCDIFFNAVAGPPWSVQAQTPPDRIDVEAVILHEAGHCLGLDHFGLAGQTIMWDVVKAGEVDRRTLTAQDIQALCLRNPVGGEVASPCLPDGGCGPTSAVKCLTQPLTEGKVQRMCSVGCTVGTGAQCPLPLVCQPSIAFAPAFDGACLLPGTSATPVGAGCSSTAQCLSSLALCQPPTGAPSGQTFWIGGHCTQGCEEGQPPCPGGATCVDFGAGGRTCHQSCRLGLGDCREGYACVATSEGGGVCLPRCFADVDCGSFDRFCRVCDGLCLPKNTPSGQIGDPCQTEATCGPGQECRPVSGTSGVRTCTQQCARGCATCPAGSLCSPSTTGDLFCVQQCTGPGTCPVGLRCGDIPGGQGCIPACVRDADCPAEQYCFQGECLRPGEDAGCGILCARPDAGPTTPPVRRDAGTGGGPGGSAGCGCNGASVDPYLHFFSMVALWRSRWRRR